MKNLLLVLFISGCSNEAITFARSIDPSAKCTAIRTAWNTNNEDVATCIVGTEVWLCTVYNVPKCDKIRDIPAEKK